MSLKKTLILAIVLAGCLLYMYRVEMPRQKEAEKKGIAFPELHGVQLEQLSISRAKTDDHAADSFVLVNTSPKQQPDPTPTPSKEALPFSDDERQAEQLKAWKLKDVPDTGLDSGAVSALIEALRSLKLDDAIAAADAGNDMSVFGLSEPSATLTVKAVNQPEKKLLLGAENELLAKRYLKIEGDQQLYMIPGGLFFAVNKAASEFRSKTPFNFDKAKIEKFSVTMKDQSKVTVARKDHSEWRITEPKELEASSTAVSALLEAIKAIRVSEFHDDGDKRLAEFGLDQPGVTVDITFSELSKKAPMTVSIAQKAGDDTGIFAKLGTVPTVFRSTGTLIGQFQKDADALRERGLFTFSFEKVKKMEFTGDNYKPLTIEHDGDVWKVNGKEGDPVFIRQVIFNVTDLNALTFPDAGPGLDKPNFRVAVELQDGKKQTLILGSTGKVGDDTVYYGRVEEGGAVVTLKEADVKKIMPIEETLVKRAEPTATAGTQKAAGE